MLFFVDNIKKIFKHKEMLRKIIFCLSVLLLSVLCLADSRSAEIAEEIISEGKTYSLSDLYRIALESSEKIGISEQNLRIAEKNREKAFAALMPDLSALGEYTKYSEEKQAEDMTVQPSWSGAYGLKLSQSFTLNGREQILFQIAEDNIAKNRYDLNAVKEDYLFSVASAYYDVLRSMKSLEISQANVGRLETHLDAVSARLRLEDVTKTAWYRAQAELSQSKSDLIRSENTLKLAKIFLADAAGLPDAVYEITDPGPMENFFSRDTPDSLKSDSLKSDSLKSDSLKSDSLKKEGLENRAELAALNLDKKIARDSVEAARGASWPFILAEANWLKYDQEPSPPNKDSLSLSLKFSFPLFDSGLRNAGVAESLARKQQADLAVKALSKQIALEIEQVRLELLTHRSLLTSLKDQLNFARENYHAVAEQFRYGLADSLDVTDANTLLVTSQKQLAESRYAFQLALLKLERAKGTFLKNIIGN